MGNNRIQALPSFPNWYPYNEMLLDGKLEAKTRSAPWKHRGPVLLYTSTRAELALVRVHGYDAATHVRGSIVGVGDLVAVRDLSDKEYERLFRQFNNLGSGKITYQQREAAEVYPLPVGYFFKGLVRFSHPIPYRPSPGPVRTFPIPLTAEIRRELLAAGYEVTADGVKRVEKPVRRSRASRNVRPAPRERRPAGGLHECG